MAALSGNYWVRVVVPAIHEARSLLPKTRDRMILRRHALKLRYWPEKHPEMSSGQVLDVDWSWIKALKGLDVGELRIDDVIGGFDNLRLIFYVHKKRQRNEPLPSIFVLLAMQKKRNEFTDREIKIFKSRRLLVLTRYYGPRP